MADPCLSCPLPDCDETSPRCGLRRAAKQYASHKRNREPVPDAVREGWQVMDMVWRIEREARLSEGGR